MTMKEVFKKVESYNELADLMYARKAQVYFSRPGGLFGDSFSTYKEFQKYINDEYVEPLAEMILKSDEWNFDENAVVFDWTDSFGDCYTSIFYVEICGL